MIKTVRRALLSVSDKTGLVELARALVDRGVEIISTGGTHAALRAAGLTVSNVSDVTGFPEILDGRVKTLHPVIHAGLLAQRENPAHVVTLAEHGIGPIDLLVCNLYPFESVASQPDADPSSIIEQIDIGGPSMIRAAAKNHHDVIVIVEPSQYAELLAELAQHDGATTPKFRRALAAFAFARTAAYDAAIARWFDPGFPHRLTLAYERVGLLRYGENPHQTAAFYAEPAFRSAATAQTASGAGNTSGASDTSAASDTSRASSVSVASVASAQLLHGKELSYNNLLDLDSALNLVRDLASPAVAIIKHNNPCGVAVARSAAEAFQLAYDADPQSAFGGIIALNVPVDAATAQAMSEPGRFIECIIAPSFAAEALELLTTRPSWKKSVRLLQCGPVQALPPAREWRCIFGGLLVQDRDIACEPASAWKLATRHAATAEQLADLEFAWRVCKHVKSNAIVLAKGGRTVGIGAGQMSRVDAVRLAIQKAADAARGSVLASDAFFPFRDNVDAAAAAGVVAIVQPGGSVRDADSVTACEEQGLAMYFTGTRHFRH